MSVYVDQYLAHITYNLTNKTIPRPRISSPWASTVRTTLVPKKTSQFYCHIVYKK